MYPPGKPATKIPAPSPTSSDQYVELPDGESFGLGHNGPRATKAPFAGGAWSNRRA